MNQLICILKTLTHKEKLPEKKIFRAMKSNECGAIKTLKCTLRLIQVKKKRRLEENTTENIREVREYFIF